MKSWIRRRASARSAAPRAGPAWNDDAAREFVRTCYAMLLGREPDPGGEEHYTASLLRGDPPGSVLSSLLQSAEAKSHLWRLAMAPRWQPPLLPVDLERAVIDEPALAPDRYEELWSALARARERHVVGQAQYLLDHKRRFREHFNAVLFAVRGLADPQALEFGATQFSAMYAQLRPDLRLDICDRPAGPDYPGFTEERCRALFKYRDFYSADLERLEESPGPPEASYDLVVFTEVIEHLVVDPVALLAWLLRRLKRTGRLFLTTPNFLRRENLELVRRGMNPQPLYPGLRENWDAHFHFREYVAPEIFELAERAGGRVEGFYYSSCWDEDPNRAPKHERGDLAFLIALRHGIEGQGPVSPHRETP